MNDSSCPPVPGKRNGYGSGWSFPEYSEDAWSQRFKEKTPPSHTPNTYEVESTLCLVHKAEIKIVQLMPSIRFGEKAVDIAKRRAVWEVVMPLSIFCAGVGGGR